MIRHYFVYIATNYSHRVFYTGVTNNLLRRIMEHKYGFGSTFTSKYKVTKLVYYEICTDITVAIEREKQLKAGSRKKKFDLIVSTNPEFNDLSKRIF
jgi:putative endonuclease